MKSKQGKQDTKMVKKSAKISKAFQAQKNDDDDSSADASASDEEAECLKTVSKQSKSAKMSGKVIQKLAAEGESDNEEEEEDEMEEDEDESEDADEDDDSEGDDSEDEDDDEDEESDVDENDDDEDEEDEDEEGDDDDEKEEEVKPGQKRKVKQSLQPESKKAKLELTKPSGGVALFVRMASSDVESSVIEKFFTSHGIEVLQIRRIGGRNFAYADINESQLEAALKLSGKKMSGKQVQILLAKEKSDKKTTDGTSKKSDEESKKRKLFVKNLAFSLSDKEIKDHFPLAVSVEAKRKMNGQLVGYAYIEFESEENADRSMAELQNSKIKGRTICLDYIGEKRQNNKPQAEADEKCKTLCVKQLSYNTTKEELKAFFKTASEARIVNDPVTGKSKGFGFVVFDEHEDAEVAMTKRQGKPFKGRNLVITFAFKKKGKPGAGRPDSRLKRRPKQKAEGGKKPKKTTETSSEESKKTNKDGASKKAKKTSESD